MEEYNQIAKAYSRYLLIVSHVNTYTHLRLLVQINHLSDEALSDEVHLKSDAISVSKL